jgi:hypothetical protein
MRRATHPTELIGGFFAGLLAAFFIQLPFIWGLHQLGLTAQYGFSENRVLPMGAMAMWTRTFWGGVYGLGLAAFGSYLPFGRRYLWETVVAVAVGRTLIDWFPAPMLYGQGWWVGWSADGLLTPLLSNFVWAFATALLVIAFSLWAGTFGSRSLPDRIF